MAFSLKQIQEIESIFQRLNKKDLNWKIVQSIPSLLEPNTLYFHQVSINPKKYDIYHTDKDKDLAKLDVYNQRLIDQKISELHNKLDTKVDELQVDFNSQLNQTQQDFNSRINEFIEAFNAFQSATYESDESIHIEKIDNHYFFRSNVSTFEQSFVGLNSITLLNVPSNIIGVYVDGIKQPSEKYNIVLPKTINLVDDMTGKNISIVYERIINE